MDGRRAVTLQFAALALLLLAAAVILYLFPPEKTAFYPKCLLFQATGWQCPGCGGLRAAHHLLHGHFATAFHYNPLLVGLAPLLAGLGALLLLARWTGKPVPYPFRHPAWIWVLVAALVLFGVLRNV
jgi:hypothetical protein